MNTDELIATRDSTHGNYDLQSGVTNTIKYCMHQSALWEHMSPMQQESLDMIAVKLGRILTGDPDFRDHWDDIAGYAKLVADRCSK